MNKNQYILNGRRNYGLTSVRCPCLLCILILVLLVIISYIDSQFFVYTSDANRMCLVESNEWTVKMDALVLAQEFIAAAATKNESVTPQTQTDNHWVLTPENIETIIEYCAWLSDFSNESEYLFVGGLHPLQFVRIIHVVYLKCLNIINKMFDGRLYEDYGNKDKYFNKLIQRTVKKLIHHYLSRFDNSGTYTKFKNMPDYIDRLLCHCFEYRKYICIDWGHMHIQFDHWQNKGYEIAKKYICKETYEWINIDLLCELFYNLNYIEFKNGYTDKIRLCHDTMDDIFEFLSNSDSCVNVIKIQCNAETSDIKPTIAVTHYKKQFDIIGFSLDILYGEWPLTIKRKEFIKRELSPKMKRELSPKILVKRIKSQDVIENYIPTENDINKEMITKPVVNTDNEQKTDNGTQKDTDEKRKETNCIISFNNINSKNSDTNELSFFFENECDVLHKSFFGKITIPLLTNLLGLIESTTKDTQNQKIFKHLISNLLKLTDDILTKSDNYCKNKLHNEYKTVYEMRESPHPYPLCKTIKKLVTIPGAKELIITFDKTLCCTFSENDFLQLFTKTVMAL